jgi:hypothetical protein
LALASAGAGSINSLRVPGPRIPRTLEAIRAAPPPRRWMIRFTVNTALRKGRETIARRIRVVFKNMGRLETLRGWVSRRDVDTGDPLVPNHCYYVTIFTWSDEHLERDAHFAPLWEQLHCWDSINSIDYSENPLNACEHFFIKRKQDEPDNWTNFDEFVEDDAGSVISVHTEA